MDSPPESQTPRPSHRDLFKELTPQASAPEAVAFRSSTDLPSLRLVAPRPYSEPVLPQGVDLNSIRDAFNESGGHLLLKASCKADRAALFDSIDQGDTVLHVDGHGEVESESMFLIAENAATGLKEPVAVERLLDEIGRTRRDNPMLLCLSTCGGFPRRTLDVAANTEGLGGFVGFSRKVAPDEATGFFRAFYGRLARGTAIAPAIRGAAIAHFGEFPGPVIGVVRNGSWSPFPPSPPSGVEVLAENLAPAHGRDPSPELVSWRQHIHDLHSLLASDARQERVIAVVGERDTGRSIIAKCVARHVAWRFRSLVHFAPDRTHLTLSRAQLIAELSARLPPLPTRSAAVDSFADLAGNHPRGVLLLLEVEDEGALGEQTWDFIRDIAPPSAAVLIGPKDLVRHCGHAIYVEPLPEAEALFVFAGALPQVSAQVIQRVRAEFPRIYGKCGGFVGLLRRRAKSVRTLADVAELTGRDSMPTGSDGWEARSIRALKLEPAMRELLRKLALFRVPVPQVAALAACGTMPDSVLAGLVSEGLVAVSEVDSERLLTVQPTIRRLVLRGIPLPVLDELAFLQEFPRTSSTESRRATAQAWLDATRGWIERLAMDEVAPSADELKPIISFSVRFCVKEATILEDEWQFGRAADAFGRIAALLEKFDQPGSARFRRQQAALLLRTGSLEAAEHFAAALLGRKAPAAVEAVGFGLLGDVSRRRGRIQEAREFYERALEGTSRDVDPGGVAMVLAGLSEAARDAGEFRESEARLLEARALDQDDGANAEKRIARHEIARLYERLGYLYQLLRYDDAALDAYGHAANLCRSGALSVRVRVGQGDVYANRGWIGEAQRSMETALLEAKDLKNPPLAVEVLTRLARAQARAGRTIVVEELAGEVDRLVAESQLEFRTARARIEICEALAIATPEAAMKRLAGLRQTLQGDESASATIDRARGRALAAIARSRGDFEQLVQAESLLDASAAAFGELGFQWRARRTKLLAAECALEIAKGAARGSSTASRALVRVVRSAEQTAGALSDMGDYFLSATAFRLAADGAALMEDEATRRRCRLSAMSSDERHEEASTARRMEKGDILTREKTRSSGSLA